MPSLPETQYWSSTAGRVADWLWQSLPGSTAVASAGAELPARDIESLCMTVSNEPYQTVFVTLPMQ